MSYNRIIMHIAKLVSVIFSPFHFPILIFIPLMFYSYLSYTPWEYRISILLMVFVMTILAPKLCIYLYQKLNGWSNLQFGKRTRRFVPYIISIVCYGVLLDKMYKMCMPSFILRIILCAVVLQIICAIFNLMFKVSTHAAASGATIGILIALSFVLHFNPLIGISIAILINGIVCTSRLILKQHKLIDTTLGTILGVICGFLSITLL